MTSAYIQSVMSKSGKHIPEGLSTRLIFVLTVSNILPYNQVKYMDLTNLDPSVFCRDSLRPDVDKRRWDRGCGFNYNANR